MGGAGRTSVGLRCGVPADPDLRAWADRGTREAGLAKGAAKGLGGGVGRGGRPPRAFLALRPRRLDSGAAGPASPHRAAGPLRSRLGCVATNEWTDRSATGGSRIDARLGPRRADAQAPRPGGGTSCVSRPGLAARVDGPGPRPGPKTPRARENGRKLRDQHARSTGELDPVQTACPHRPALKRTGAWGRSVDRLASPPRPWRLELLSRTSRWLDSPITVFCSDVGPYVGSAHRRDRLRKGGADGSGTSPRVLAVFCRSPSHFPCTLASLLGSTPLRPGPGRPVFLAVIGADENPLG